MSALDLNFDAGAVVFSVDLNLHGLLSFWNLHRLTVAAGLLSLWNPHWRLIGNASHRLIRPVVIVGIRLFSIPGPAIDRRRVDPYIHRQIWASFIWGIGFRT
ncbi:hypothetical protein, partial [Agrococcus casei]|uniref:hypothetical protein n=1 Tax=Agrococcus casei TaxID=343512 RepID=UPI003F901AF3